MVKPLISFLSDCSNDNYKQNEIRLRYLLCYSMNSFFRFKVNYYGQNSQFVISEDVLKINREEEEVLVEEDIFKRTKAIYCDDCNLPSGRAALKSPDHIYCAMMSVFRF